MQVKALVVAYQCHERGVRWCYFEHCSLLFQHFRVQSQPSIEGVDQVERAHVQEEALDQTTVQNLDQGLVDRYLRSRGIVHQVSPIGSDLAGGSLYHPDL